MPKDPAYMEQVNGYCKLLFVPGSTEVKHLLYALVTDYGLEEINNELHER